MEVSPASPNITEEMTPNASLPEVPIQFAQKLTSPASERGAFAESSPAPTKGFYASLRGVNIDMKPRFYAAGTAFACESVQCFRLVYSANVYHIRVVLVCTVHITRVKCFLSVYTCHTCQYICRAKVYYIGFMFGSHRRLFQYHQAASI